MPVETKHGILSFDGVVQLLFGPTVGYEDANSYIPMGA